VEDFRELDEDEPSFQNQESGDVLIIQGGLSRQNLFRIGEHIEFEKDQSIWKELNQQ